MSDDSEDDFDLPAPLAQRDDDDDDDPFAWVCAAVRPSPPSTALPNPARVRTCTRQRVRSTHRRADRLGTLTGVADARADAGTASPPSPPPLRAALSRT